MVLIKNRKIYIVVMYNTYYKEMKYIKKTITITEKQEKWIKDNSINLSRFVQKEIDKKCK